MMQKYGTLVIVLIVAVSAWLAGLPGQFIETRPSEPVPQHTEQPQSIDALTDSHGWSAMCSSTSVCRITM